MKLYKLIFFNTMMMGTLVTVSSYSWFSMWMGLEINLLSVIPLFSDHRNILSSESSLKYFITQAMASLVLLMAVIMLLLINEFITPQMNFYFLMIMNSALMMKLGAAPFHFWFPEVMEGLNWVNCTILLTWQKIAPMSMIMNNSINYNFMMIIILFSLLISTLMGFNQTSLRKMMAFSSINHIAWMLSSMLVSFSLWFIYFLVYCLINLNIIMIFIITKSYYLNQTNNMMNNNKMIKISFMLNFLSLGGLPPFIGFLPKWLLINSLTANNLFALAFIMIVSTLIMLFVYLRVAFSSMMISTNESKLKMTKINQFHIMTINMISLMSLIACTIMFNFY